MMQAILWWLPVVLMVGGMALVLFWMWMDCPKRSPEDIVEFLQHVDLEKFRTTLDPTTEAALRDQMGMRAFRREQRKRVHLCIEFLKRMSHNAGLLTEVASRMAYREDDLNIRQAGMVLREHGVQVKIYAITTILKLRLRLLVRMDSWFMFGALSLYGVRESCGIRGLESYDKLKTAASFLFLQLHSNRFEDLIEVL